MQRLLALLVGAAGLMLATTANAQTTYTEDEFSSIEANMNAALDAFETQEIFAPGYVVVVATADGHSWIRAGGVLRVGRDMPTFPTSEFYIASMTKAYMGLLAAHLDEQGVLPLDATLADCWPDLLVPGDVPADQITLRDLITHQIPIEVDEIVSTEAYFRDLSPGEYPHYIETYGVPRAPGFQYDNLGYNIYGAILEQVTGRNWRDWLNEVIFEPNGMDGTSGRVTDFDTDTIAWGHQIDTGIAPVWPTAEGWYLIPPKTDGMMQAAGGLMTTAEDFATWLRMNLTHEAIGIDAAVFAEAQMQHVAQEGDGHGFSDEGYAYGWNNAILIHDRPDASGEIPAPTNLLQHGGGYTGFASLITFAPELGIGVAVAFNTDSVINFAGLVISKQVFELAIGIEGTEEAIQNRVATFASYEVRLRDARIARMTGALANERWGDGGWSPDTAALDAFVGRYEGNSWIPYVEITRDGEILHAQVFDAQRYVVPVSQDIFTGIRDGSSAPEFLHFRRDENGNITGLLWDDDEFTRVPAY